MTPQQKENALLIDKELQSLKLTNKFLRAGILAVVMKESGMIPIEEKSYAGTPNSRIRQIWPPKFAKMSDAELSELKTYPEKFFNYVYDGIIGNLPGTNDGWRYRGRGYNQLTGRGNYKFIGGKIGIDLVTDPSLLARPEIAAKACARFFYDNIVSCQRTGRFLFRHKILTTSQISSLEQGALIAHDCNGGFGIWPPNDPTGGFKATQGYSLQMLHLIEA